MQSKGSGRISFYFKREKKRDKDNEESTRKSVKKIEKLVKESEINNENCKKDINKQRNNIGKKNENLKVQQPVRRSTRNLQSKSQETIPQDILKEPNIDDLPIIHFKGKIQYTCDYYDIAETCDKLLHEIEQNPASKIPIGFDLEWPFTYQTGSGKSALVQICMLKNVCHLFHIYTLQQLPKVFIIMLSHPKVKLVGVNIKNDIRKLARDFSEFPGSKVVEKNCIDSGVYLNKIINRSCRWSLKRLTAYLLHKQITKNSTVRLSKWNILPLSNAQKIYAATDAYVSLLNHLKIEELAKEKEIEEADKERRKKEQLLTGEITEPELFAIR